MRLMPCPSPVATALCAALLLCLAVPLAAAWAQGGQRPTAYPNTEMFGSKIDTTAAWFTRCMEVRELAPPPGDAVEGSPDCEPTDMYYDALDNPQATGDDWAKVRACAQATDDPGVLMMLYANGLGVRRNLPLALKYACTLGGAQAELEGRAEHLAKLIDGAPAAKPAELFDICDDITSGYMQGVCTGIASSRAQGGRDDRLDRLAAKLPPAQRKQWDKLQKAAQAFAEARGDRETDMTGTARAALSIAAKDAELDLLVEDAERFEKGDLPSGTPERFAQLDAELNKLYQAIMRAKSEDENKLLGSTSIAKPDVQATQKAWLRYRDALTAYGRARYPAVPAEAWKALLTRRRADQLRELLDMAGVSAD